MLTVLSNDAPDFFALILAVAIAVPIVIVAGGILMFVILNRDEKKKKKLHESTKAKLESKNIIFDISFKSATYGKFDYSSKSKILLFDSKQYKLKKDSYLLLMKSSCLKSDIQGDSLNGYHTKIQGHEIPGSILSAKNHGVTYDWQELFIVPGKCPLLLNFYKASTNDEDLIELASKLNIPYKTDEQRYM